MTIFVFKLVQGLIFWQRLGDPFVYQNSKEFYASHFLGWILVCAIPFGDMVKFIYFEQFPVDCLSHPVMPSFVLVHCICLLCD